MNRESEDMSKWPWAKAFALVNRFGFILRGLLGSSFPRKRESRKQHWISPYQVRGRLVAVRLPGMTASRTWGSDTPLLAAR
jgi:hypothetical protein